MKNNRKIIHVKASKEYDVLIEKGLLDKVGEIFKDKFLPCKVAVITDDVVDGLYVNGVINSLKSAGFSTVKFVLKNGEESKNFQTYFDIVSFLAKNQLSRTDMVVALGGGVVGDIAGFSASTYLRGIKYVQIPTTLLSQIDSSVGGKTAIDLKEGKNLVGAFYQPELVLCDINTLSTLPEKIYVDGLGEGVKYALLDKKVFDLIKNGQFDLSEFVYLCVDYKRKIVEQDEFESGNRKLLNLGHTIAHGIEKLSSYTISHGNAVAMGILHVLNASKKHGFISKGEYDEMISVIENTLKGKLDGGKYALDKILECAVFDKKRVADYISVVMVKGVGACTVEKVKLTHLKEYFL